MKKLVIYFFGILIILISILSTIVSTGLSILYFTNLSDDTTLQLVVVGFIIILQSMVLLGSIVKSTIYKRCPQHYSTIKIFTNICFIISVLSTISFFNQFDKSQREKVIVDLLNLVPFDLLVGNEWLINNLTNMTLIWLSCITIDLMSMYFPSIGSDLISGISTRQKIEIQEMGYISKILKIVFHKPKNLIDKKCIQLGYINVSDTPIQEKSDTKNPIQEIIIPIQENPNTETEIQEIETNNVSDTKSNETLAINECIPCNGYVSENKTEYIIPDTIPDTKLNTEIIKPDTEIKTKNVSDTKKMGYKKPDTNEIQKKIDEYIILNYVSGEKINVSQLKKEFGFKSQDRTWADKIRPYLKSCYINPENNRLTRINLEKKDKIKLVK